MDDLDLVDSSNDLNNPEQLRARAKEEGYLFFRALLPVEDVLRMREELLAVVQRHGLAQSRCDSLDGTLDVEQLKRVPIQDLRQDIGVPTSLYNDVQKLPATHRLPHHPRLLALYERLFDHSVFVHPRHVVRMVTPHPDVTPTPIHQDFPHIQGSPDTWTCWFPIGDCPRNLGGLSVLKGSHRHGYLPVHKAPGAGGLSVELCPNETEWLSIDYRAGDVLTFPSYTLHKALPCHYENQIRLSFDVRYQSAQDTIERRSLEPHCELTWEQIYADWDDADRDLQYYWQRNRPKISAWDDSLFTPGRRIC